MSSIDLLSQILAWFAIPLWALLHATIVLIFSCSRTGDDDHVFVKSPFKIWDNVSDVFNFVRTKRVVGTICLLTWTILDVFINILVFAISVGLYAYVFTDADGIIEKCWAEESASMIASAVFTGISFLCDVVIVIGLITLLCKNYGKAEEKCGIVMTENDKRCNSATAGLQVCLWIAAFICLSACLHDYIRSAEYVSVQYSGCDPMVSKRCLMPFPSSYWLRDDPSTITGYRVEIGSKTLPYAKRGSHTSPTVLNRYDGFAVGVPIIWHLPNVNEAELISFEYIDRSVLVNSTSLIIELETGATHPHFTEKDYLDPSDDRMMYSIPASALKFNTTYVVVIKNLTRSNGALLPPAPLWQKYKSAYVSNGSIDGDARFDRFKTTVFPLLHSLNIPLEATQLVWDFHTVSAHSMSEKLMNVTRITDVKVAHEMSNERLSYRHISTTTSDCPKHESSKIAAASFYRIDVPWFLESFEASIE